MIRAHFLDPEGRVVKLWCELYLDLKEERFKVFLMLWFFLNLEHSECRNININKLVVRIFVVGRLLWYKTLTSWLLVYVPNVSYNDYILNWRVFVCNKSLVQNKAAAAKKRISHPLGSGHAWNIRAKECLIWGISAMFPWRTWKFFVPFIICYSKQGCE